MESGTWVPENRHDTGIAGGGGESQGVLLVLFGPPTNLPERSGDLKEVSGQRDAIDLLAERRMCGGQAVFGGAGESGARMLGGSLDTPRRSWQATSMVVIR